MSGRFPDIKTVIARVITNKPVRKTPYQVKGVFMRHHSDESIIPMLDGSYRDRFLYPRVQVKILNEQIYLIGVNEGVEPVIALTEKINSLDFGNITIDIDNFEIEEFNQQFIPSPGLISYRFITPWVALNHMTGGKYKKLSNIDKQSFLNKLLGQNIVFLANEVGINLEDNIYTKVKVENLSPKSIDDNKWGAFKGEFKTNFILPNYIGIGNGITRGYGTLYGNDNQESPSIDEKKLINDSKNNSLNDLENRTDLESISASDVPKPKRKKRTKNKRKNPKSNYRLKKSFSKNRKGKPLKRKKESRYNYKKNVREGRVFSEDYIIEDESNNSNSTSGNENMDDQRFNTEKHHKKQHKF